MRRAVVSKRSLFPAWLCLWVFQRWGSVTDDGRLNGPPGAFVSSVVKSVPKRSWWATSVGVLLILSLFFSVWAWIVIAGPVATLGNIARHSDHFGLVFAHMLGGTLMLFCGAANLYIGSTRRYFQHFQHHQLIGRCYLIGGTLAAIIAIVLALSPAHKADGTVMFTNLSASLSLLASAWMVAAAMAVRAVRNRRFDAHSSWMIRSYVLAWSFVFCRLASRVPAVAEFGGGEAFIWMSWIMPVLACEVGLQWTAGAARPPIQTRV